MSSRISALSLQCLYRKKNSAFPLISCFDLKSRYYSSSVPNIRKTINPENLKKIQFPKFVEPFKNDSVEEILSAVNQESLMSKEAISVLKALRMQILFKNIDSNSFKNDKKFEILCKVFEQNCSTLSPTLLVSGLRSLLEVGISPESKCVVSAEENILKKVSIFSAFNLIGCLYFHHKYIKTDLQQKVVTALCSELCRRTYEISKPTEALMLVHFLHIFKNEDDLKKIENQILKIIPYLDVNELCKMLGTLAENSNRDICLLRAIFFNLQKKIEVIGIKNVLDILYSFKKLNFYEYDFLSDLMDKVVQEIPKTTQPSVISGILNTAGSLRWKQYSLLKNCGEWIISHIDSCRSREFAAYILCVATVNQQDSEVKHYVQSMLPHINLQNVESPDIWLDIVWSLAILNLADKETLLQVLSPDFYEPLITGSNFQTEKHKLKLMNLKAVLKRNYPESFFGCNLHLEPIQVPQSTESENSRKHVIKVLRNFLPKDKYMLIGQNTNIGVHIDAEFIMDEYGKPHPIENFKLSPNLGMAKALKKEYHRIALLILFHKDYTLHSNSITGYNSLATQLLCAEGYTVVRIPFDEFMKNPTEVKKIKYLMNKITRTISKFSGAS